MEYLLIIPIAMFTIGLYGLLLLLVDKLMGTSLACSRYGWHNGKLLSSKGYNFDGCSNHAKCSKCGRDVMQDGQGNWFTTF